MIIGRFLLVLFLVFMVGCKNPNNPPEAKNKPCTVTIKTAYGNIKLLLYNSTPKHRDNFLRLVRQGFYNGVIFHRVVKNYIIQAGDPYSKGASLKTNIGSGDIGYTIPPEIAFPQAFHKRGALAAARLGEDENPNHYSSGCQFYIVTGELFSEAQLNEVEELRRTEYKNRKFAAFVRSHKREIDLLTNHKNTNAVKRLENNFRNQLEIEVTESRFIIPQQVREVYKTIGGAPNLDRDYTVFGEVISGMAVVDAITMLETNRNERPTTNVVISAYVD